MALELNNFNSSISLFIESRLYIRGGGSYKQDKGWHKQHNPLSTQQLILILRSDGYLQ